MNGNPPLDFIHVQDSCMVLAIDHELEKRRSALYMPLLMDHGAQLRNAPPFDYAKYAPLDPFVRCFDNAMETALRYGLIYVEGLLILLTTTGKLVSMAHGWCEDAHGVVDPTCHKNQNNPSVYYLGLPLKLQYSLDWKERVGYYGCLDGDQQGRPIGVHHEPPSTWIANRYGVAHA